MNEQMQQPYGPQWGPIPPTPPKSKPAWWKARWVPIVGVGVLALIVGTAIGSSGSSTKTAAPKTVTVTAPPLPAVTSVKPATADEQAAIDAKNREADAKVAAAQPAIDAKNQQADARSAALDQREAAVAAREKAVGATEATIAANTIPGDGTFLVGKDVKPGTYRTTGPKSRSCYWQRSGDASGTNIIANDILSGPGVVDIRSSDVSFKTSGCANWTLVR